MESHFKKDTGSKNVKNAGTRLYAPAVEKAKPETDPETGEVVQDETVEATPVQFRAEAAKGMSSAGRIGIMVCAFIFAGMLIFILSGYERISRAYSDINTLNNDIDEVKLHISALNVSIECAVTIDDAEKAALAAGMTYPSQSQIFTAGQTIPAPNTGNTGVISDTSDSESNSGEEDASGETPSQNLPDVPDEGSEEQPGEDSDEED